MAEVGTPPVRAERKDRAAGAWTNLVEEADDGGEGTAEPVVNVYTKLKDNKRCVSCALWGRRRFFGDWEWREAKPRCKKCVKDSVKAKDAAKFGRRANFIAMNRTASSTRGGTASEFGESNDGGSARAVRANSAQARASDASRRPRSVAALRERRLSAGSNANTHGFGGRDDDDDDYDATSPPNRFSPDGARASASLGAYASRGGGAAMKHAHGSANGKKGSLSNALSPDGDWAGAYYSRRGERGYDPAAEARALEASLPTRAQRVLERAAILTGRGDSYRPTSTMSDAGPRGGRTLARRFGAFARDPRKEPLIAAKERLFARRESSADNLARGVAKKEEETGGYVSDDDADDVFVSRVPEVRRSTLYPGAGYVPVRERLASGDAGAARYSFSSRGSVGSASSGGAFGASRRVAESAPVTPLYRRGPLFVGGSDDRAAFGTLGETDRGEASQSQSQSQRSRPSSYVAGLMGKSGFGALDATQSTKSISAAAAPRDASPFAEASSRTPRAASHLAAPPPPSGTGIGIGGKSPSSTEGRIPGATTNGRRATPGRTTTSLKMTSADLDRALFASRETLSAKKAPPSALSPTALAESRLAKLDPKAISKPSQELDARLSMYAPARRSAASSRTKTAFAAGGEEARTPASAARLQNARHISEPDSFDELRPTPPSARPGAEESSAPSTPFDAVPSAMEALALRDADRDDEEARFGTWPNPNSPGSGLWYGSSAKTPNRAFRAVLDACRLAEEDAFAYKGLRTGRFVLDPDGAAARSFLSTFVRDAHRKNMTPAWWTEAHSDAVVRHALDPTHELFSDFAAHIGEPDGATRDELVQRWGVAGTEALRDFHFDVRPEPWERRSEEEGADVDDDDDDDDDARRASRSAEGDAIRVADADAARALVGDESSDRLDRTPPHVVCVVAPGSSLVEDEGDERSDGAYDGAVGLPDWEDADAATRGVVVALREANASCAPLAFRVHESDDEATEKETNERSRSALDLAGKKAVVFLGVGADLRNTEFDGDGCRLVGASAARVDALRSFVERGGVFVVNGSGESAERAFGWFGLPWRFSGEAARGEYAPDARSRKKCFVFSETSKTPTLDAWARGERGFYVVKGEGIVHVAPEHRVFTRVGASALSPDAGGDDDDACPLAAARFGLGAVVFAGDAGGGDATCELIASLACLPPGETREYPGK